MILSPIEQRIKAKIEEVGVSLKDWDIQINYGIKTGCNEAFIISGEKRRELIKQDPKSEEIIRPILRGRDIKRYGYDFADLYLLFIPWHFPLHTDVTIQGASDIAEQAFKQQFPAIYNHLLQYKKELSNRNKAETGIRYEWYALQRWGANYWEDFYKQKIVWKRVGSILRFCYDENHFVLDSTCFAAGNHIIYLVAILNSKLVNYMLQDAPKTGTGDLLISVQAIEPLRIPIPNIEIEQKIENLLQAKEYQVIDKIVYDIYNLTKEEIGFIESQ
ncbi:MAG: class I SAM-dependent DNA methyltransferase [Prevotellaceae bacterium]|nr:class I SAM-dependent DNA methyltransferase [Prevotellaceae bacterium]